MVDYLISIPISEKVENETIHDRESKLKVRVFDLLKSKFTPHKGEKRFFVTDGKKTLAFETQGYNKHQVVLILHMISWYCIYLGLMEAQIHATWPNVV